jgi:hypothetical protein
MSFKQRLTQFLGFMTFSPTYYTDKKKLNDRVFINYGLIISFLILGFMSFSTCKTCSFNYQPTKVEDLYKKTGVYKISPPSAKSPGGRGGILVKNGFRTDWCGGRGVEALKGQPAIGWYDDAGNIYQLAVSGAIVCTYEEAAFSNSIDRTFTVVYVLLALVFSCVQVRFLRHLKKFKD